MTDKLTYLHERVYCCRSGSAADTQVRRDRFVPSTSTQAADSVYGMTDTQAIADVAHSQLQMYAMVHSQRPTVSVAATLLEGLCYSNKLVHSFTLLFISHVARKKIQEQHADLTRNASSRDQLSAGIIVAGWDKDNGGTVYNIPLGGGLFKGPWAIGGE